jgi:hypothetical protein
MLASAQAFEAGEITVYQTVATKPGAPHPLPLDRTELLHPDTATSRRRATAHEPASDIPEPGTPTAPSLEATDQGSSRSGGQSHSQYLPPIRPPRTQRRR